MIYGHRAASALNNPLMGHKTGFTASTLKRRMEEAGFIEATCKKDGLLNLWGYGCVPTAISQVA